MVCDHGFYRQLRLCEGYSARVVNKCLLSRLLSVCTRASTSIFKVLLAMRWGNKCRKTAILFLMMLISLKIRHHAANTISEKQIVYLATDNQTFVLQRPARYMLSSVYRVTTKTCIRTMKRPRRHSVIGNWQPNILIPYHRCRRLSRKTLKSMNCRFTRIKTISTLTAE